MNKKGIQLRIPLSAGGGRGFETSSCIHYLFRTTRLGQHFLMFRNSRFVLHHRKPNNQWTTRVKVQSFFRLIKISVPGLISSRPECSVD